MPAVVRAILVTAALLLLATDARAADEAPVVSRAIALAAPNDYTLLPYKGGQSWPGRSFQGLDFLEPFFPIAAGTNGDVGRIVLNTGLPAAMLFASLAYEPHDRAMSREIQRHQWNWVSVDEGEDNYPFLFGLVAVATASALLPAPEDEYGYSWDLRLDRITVLGLGMAVAALEREALVFVFDKPRPDGSHYTSVNDARPSGHAASAFSSMAFLSNVLRDTLRPQDEANVPLRVAEEVLTALPYLPAFYAALARTHSRKHEFTDTLLGGALGAFTMNLFYSWSFTRREQGRSWTDSFALSWSFDPDRGLYFAVAGRF